MAITVGKLFKNATILYHMKLIGGHKGLDRLVQWVHIIEDEEVSAFLHGQELVFTAGILNTGEAWFLQFVKNLYEIGTSAFVINIGPHVKSVPQSVIDFCDEVSMPLFTIPWHTHMVDMTRDFCLRIIKNEDVEISMSTTIKNIIFGIGDLETQMTLLERYGYTREDSFCVVAIELTHHGVTQSESDEQRVKQCAEAIARSLHELYICFSYNDKLILALVDYSIYDVEQFTETFLERITTQLKSCRVQLGVSSNMRHMSHQQSNFNRALEALKMAKKQEKSVIYYDKLGVYKLLLSVDDPRVLDDFYQETVGKLEVYDRENETELMAFLKVYLENNGSPQLVSEKQFVHRNTVANQLKKIARLTGYDPLDLEDRVKLYLALYIKEIIT